MCTMKYIRFISYVLTRWWQRGMHHWITIDHYSYRNTCAYVTLCEGWNQGVKLQLSLTSAPCHQLSPLIQLLLLQQPEGSRQMLQMYFLCKTDSNNFSFRMRRVSHRAGLTRHWTHLVCGQKMRCELVASWKGPPGSSGTPTVCYSLKDFVPLSQCSDGFSHNCVLGENWLNFRSILFWSIRFVLGRKFIPSWLSE